MAKDRKNKKQPQNKNTSLDNFKKLNAERINKEEAKKEQESRENPRVVKLIEEYEKKKTELDAEANALLDKKKELDKREDEIKKAEKAIEEKIISAQNDAIAEIKNNEQKIRQEEYARLLEEWKKEAEQKSKALTKDADELRQQAAKELNEAHNKNLQADNEKLARIYAADLDIEKRNREFLAQYEKDREFLRMEKNKLDQQKMEFQEEKDEINNLKLYLKELKKRYDECSESEVLRLKDKINSYEQKTATYKDMLEEKSKLLAKYEAMSQDNGGCFDIGRIEILEKELIKAQQELDKYSNFPTEARLAELQRIEVQADLYKNKYEELQIYKEKNEMQKTQMALEKRELQNKVVEAEALATLNEQLQDKLKFITEQYKANRESKFAGLIEIDNTAKFTQSNRPSFRGDLAALVKYLRNYGAKIRTENPLYYSEETIKAFVASLATEEPASRLIILQGLSGTGKTSLPKLFTEALDLKIDIISVQPSWRDNRELLGYDNDFTNRFKETEFTKAIYRASLPQNRNTIHLIVLDEMNLARIEYYFADFLSCLEDKDTSLWRIPLVSNYSESEESRPKALAYMDGTASLVITPNIWFIGTANNDDSTSQITDKVYDRAQILDMDKREKEFPVDEPVQPVCINYDALHQLFEEARNNNNLKLDEDDWANIGIIDEVLKEMQITFGNRMKMQLEIFVPVYRACGGEKEDAIDYFLAHKILRKLENRYDKYLSDKFKELLECLSLVYPKGKFDLSNEKLESIKKKNGLGDEV